MRAAHAALFVGLGLTSAAACTEILGVGGTHEPIGVAVCICTKEAERLGADPRTCQQTVAKKLLRDADVTAAWIAQYKELGCDSCSKLPACLRIAPLCASATEECTTNADCCDGLGCDENGTCSKCVGADAACSGTTPCCGVELACDATTNQCKQCSTVEEACDDSRDCCGFGQIDVYCDKAEGETKGICASEQGCKHRGEPCENDDECCGARFPIPDPDNPGMMVAAGVCQNEGANKQCVERCNPENPDNCFGCCGRRYVRVAPEGGEYLCNGDASCSPRSCVRDGGTFEKTSCSEGETCTSLCSGLLCNDVCLTP